MDTLKNLGKPTSLTWDYDEEADVLYISIGEPGAAIGVDIGHGLVLRYDEARREFAGLTVLGLRDRAMQGLTSGEPDADGKHSPEERS